MDVQNSALRDQCLPRLPVATPNDIERLILAG